MNTKIHLIAGLALASVFTVSGLVHAQSKETPADKRFYIAPAVTYDFFDEDSQLDDDAGYRLSVGKPISDKFNLEINAFKTEADAKSLSVVSATPSSADGSIEGVGLNVLYFPRRYHSPFFGVLSANAGEFESFAGTDDSSLTLEAGFGYLHPLSPKGRVSLRAEYRFRNTEIERELDDDLTLHDNVISFGVQIALGATKSTQMTDPGDWRNPALPGPGDDDQDGVLNPKDKCPNTPRGQKVLENGCALQKGTALRLEGVYFDFDSDRLQPRSRRALDQAVDVLKASSAKLVEISGHTDSKGSAAYNERLSKSRAAAVRAYLVKAGIDPRRLVSRGYGEYRPVAANAQPDGSDNPAGRAQNRRVELTIVE